MNYPYRELKIIFSTFPVKIRLGFILLSIFLIMLGGLEVIGLIAIAPVIKEISAGEKANLWGFIIAITVLIIKSLLSLLALAISFKMAGAAEVNLTKLLAQKYFSPDSRNFFVSKPGDIVATLESGTSTALNGFFVPAIGILAESATSIAIISIVFIISPITALISSITFLSAGIVIRRYSRHKISQASSQNETTFKESYSKLHSLILGFKIYMPLGKSSALIDWFMTSRTKLSVARGLLDFFSSSPRYIIELALLLAVLSLLWVLSSTQGAGAAFSAAALLFIAGSRIGPSVQRAFTHINRIKSNKPIITKISNWIPKNNFPISPRLEIEIWKDSVSEICLKDVTFFYDQKSGFSLRNVSNDFKLGKINFILGKSGSGKSTLCDLLIGTLLPASGFIIYKSGIRKIDHQVEIAYIPQEFMRFSASIKDNLTFAFNDSVDEKRLIKILKQVGLNEWISKLPEGIDTFLDPISTNLSGGQSQRLSIARALYFNSPIIIFDEPTSALDRANSQAVMELIRKSATKKLVIVVTHDTGLPQIGDFVISLQNGEVVQSGTIQAGQEFLA